MDLDGTLIREDAQGRIIALPGARETMRRWRQMGHRIVIHTCRISLARDADRLDEELQLVTALLADLDIEYDEIFVGDKMVADAYVDDRAVSFAGDWGETHQAVLSLLERRSPRRQN